MFVVDLRMIFPPYNIITIVDAHADAVIQECDDCYRGITIGMWPCVIIRFMLTIGAVLAAAIG